MEQIPLKLQPFFAQLGADGLKVYINADKDITYNMLITVLDQLRTLGVKKVSFAVKKGHAFTPPAPGAAPANP